MEKNIEIFGLNISYIDSGEGDIVLILHGWGSNKESFTPVINHLCKNYRVIAPDIAGFGKSDEIKEAWDIGDYAKFINEFIAKLEIKDATWMGHSFGGRIIIKLASSAIYQPKNIVLIDSAGIKPKRTVKYYFKVYSYKIAKKLLTLPILGKYTKGMYNKLRASSGSSDYRNASDMMKASMIKVVNEDIRHYLPDIKQSVLLVWGDKDTATPISDAKIMEKLLPNCGLVVLKGAAHYSYLDKLGQFLRVIDYFLTH